MGKVLQNWCRSSPSYLLEGSRRHRLEDSNSVEFRNPSIAMTEDPTTDGLGVCSQSVLSYALSIEQRPSKVESSMWAKRFSFDRCFGEEDSDSGEGQEKVGETTPCIRAR